MFTGIVQDVGTIRDIRGNEYTIFTKIDNLKVGDSISVNGVCLTITNFDKPLNSFKVFVSKETKNVTTFKFMRISDKVNLEPALTVGDKLSGHLLMGHVDTMTEVTSIKKLGESFIFKFKTPTNYKQFLAKKGSVAIDGVSLTVAELLNTEFAVSIIPYTYENTTFKFYKIGRKVNIEFDILAKYVHSLVVGV